LAQYVLDEDCDDLIRFHDKPIHVSLACARLLLSLLFIASATLAPAVARQVTRVFVSDFSKRMRAAKNTES
jgi:hypothetical protein